MPEQALRRVLRTFRAAAQCGIVGMALLGVSIAIAAVRFERCGASAVDASDAACRTGAHLLMGAYCVLSIALILGAVSLTLLWRLRRRRRQDRR